MNEAPTADGGPGFLAFVAFFVLALALWFLMRNMNARMRRMSYRQQQAHRGKDDPQVAPGEVVLEEEATASGAGPAQGDHGATPGPAGDGPRGDGAVAPDGTDGPIATDGPSGDGPRGGGS